MSDHWKLLANLLGTPGPAEPAAKEPKKKPDVSLGENKSTVDSPSGNPIPRDPLAEIVIRQPEPVVPGFDVPAPAPVAEKPAKRSAWDTLIGTLGIKPASEPEPVESASAVSESAALTQPRPTQSAPASRPFAGDVPTLSVRDEGRPTKRGFGSGLVDSFDPSDDAGAPSIDRDRPTDSTPARIPSFREPEPREPRESNDSRPRRNSGSNIARASESRSSEFQSSEPRSAEPRSAGPRSSEGRSPEPRSGETRPRDSRPSNTPRRDEPRQSDSRKRDSRPRDTHSEESPAPRRNDPKQDLPPKARGFGDGLDNTDGILDWDVDQDDVYLRDDDLIDDGVDVDEPASDAGRTVVPASRREEEGRPRGRGRRGGSRNRGRDDSRNEAPVEPVSDDIIGWGDDVVADDGGDDDSIAEPIRPKAPRADAGRADSGKPRRDDGRDESRSGRGREPRRDAAPRDEIRREPTPARDSQRREPVRDEVRRDVPACETPRRQDRPEDATPADGGRTGRRGQRQQMGAAGPVSPRASREETRLPEVELDYDDLMSEELPSPSAAPAADSGDEPTRPRRRRGRRGRGGVGVNDSTTSDREPISRSRTVEEVGFDDTGFAAELSPDAIDSVELNDDHEDDEEAEQIRRSRRRGRGRSEPRERSEPVGNVDSLLPAADDAVSVSKNRVPTWLDTVSLLVEPNIERHRRTGPPRSPQNRGGRR